MLDRTCLVPSDRVNSRSAVRSRRADLKSASDRMLIAKNNTIARAIPSTPRRLRSDCRSFLSIGRISTALLELDQGRVDEQAHGDQGDEQDDVAQVEHALSHGIEAREQAQPGDGVDQEVRGPG